MSELDDFVGQVMAAITRQLGADSSALRLLNLEQNTVTVELLFQDGRVMSSAEAKYPECWRSLSLDEQRVVTFLVSTKCSRVSTDGQTQATRNTLAQDDYSAPGARRNRESFRRLRCWYKPGNATVSMSVARSVIYD